MDNLGNNTLLDFIERYPEKPWEWEGISQNSNIEPWSWQWISCNNFDGPRYDYPQICK